MTKEFNLSEKRRIMLKRDIIPTKDVREFIRLIMCSWSGLRKRTPDMQKVIDVFVKNIKKLAGDKLNG